MSRSRNERHHPSPSCLSIGSYLPRCSALPSLASNSSLGNLVEEPLPQPGIFTVDDSGMTPCHPLPHPVYPSTSYMRWSGPPSTLCPSPSFTSSDTHLVSYSATFERTYKDTSGAYIEGGEEEVWVSGNHAGAPPYDPLNLFSSPLSSIQCQERENKVQEMYPSLVQTNVSDEPSGVSWIGEGIRNPDSPPPPILPSPILPPPNVPQVATNAAIVATRRRRLHPARFRCTYGCGQTFTTKHNLKYHTNAHLGIKEYFCDRCSRAFVSPGTRTRHMKACRRHGAPQDWQSSTQLDDPSVGGIVCYLS